MAVLLAARNGEKWIKAQIDTIFDQKDVKVFLYVSIDPSSDNTEKIVNECKQKYKHLSIFKNNEKSPSSAKNFLNLIISIKQLKYDYFSFADQDDIWLNNKLTSAIKFIEKHQLDAYSSNVRLLERNKLIIKSQPFKKFDYLFEGGGPGNTIVVKNQCFLNFRQIVIKNPLILKNIWSHDWFFYAYVRSNKYKFKIDKKYYLLYRQHSMNVLGANLGARSFINRFKFVLSGKALEQSRFIAEYLNLKHDNQIQKLLFNGRFSFLYILVNINNCRRKIIDRIFMFIAIIILLIFKK